MFNSSLVDDLENRDKQLRLHVFPKSFCFLTQFPFVPQIIVANLQSRANQSRRYSSALRRKKTNALTQKSVSIERV